MKPPVDIVEDMRAYYAQRAQTYEAIYFKPERQADLRAMQAWLLPRFAGRRVLEVACGTGWWTPHGARHAKAWLATDLNPETMAIARAKAMPPWVRFATVDAYGFAQIEGQRFDGAFAAHWWSHVPLARLGGWLEQLHARLESGARVVMLDNRFVGGSSTPLSRTDADGNSYQRRSLADGSVHEVLKNFPTRDQALAAVGALGREPEWIEFDHYWILSYTVA